MPLHFLPVVPPIAANSAVKQGGYRMKQFIEPLSRLGSGNFLADQLNQFLALNQNLTVVGVTTAWKESVGRSEALLYTLIYRGGGARQYAARFQSTANSSAESLASDFFALNTAFRPTYTAIISPPNDQVGDKKILVVYQSMNDFARMCSMTSSPGAPYGDVPVSGFGDMQDPINLNRADVLAVNLGNDVWPDGGVNLLFNNVDACPDASAACCFGGIAPCCETASPIAANPAAVIVDLCAGCYPPDLLTLDTSTTMPTQTTTNTSTTQTTTATFPTTPPPVTQPTPPTTTTAPPTTTPPPPPTGWVGHVTDTNLIAPRATAYGNGRFLIIGATSFSTTWFSAMYSDDSGVTWNASSVFAYSGTWYGAGHGNPSGANMFIAVGRAAATNLPNIMRSLNGGVSWATVGPPSDNRTFYDVFYSTNIGVFFACGTGSLSDSVLIYTSSDGSTWSPSAGSSRAAYFLEAICEGNSVIVAVGQSGTDTEHIVTSTDGITWTFRPTPFAAGSIILKSVAYGNGIYLAVGGGIILTSTDAITWTAQAANGLTAMTSVTFAGGFFVALDEGPSSKGTADGVTWFDITVPLAPEWHDVSTDGVTRVAIGRVNRPNNTMALN